MWARRLNRCVDRRSIRATAGMTLIAVGLLLAISTPAFAHADLVSSTPADGAVLEEPVDRFELVFTAAVQPVSGGIRLVDSSRTIPVTVLQPSEEVVVIEPPEPSSKFDDNRIRKVNATCRCCTGRQRAAL